MKDMSGPQPGCSPESPAQQVSSEAWLHLAEEATGIGIWEYDIASQTNAWSAGQFRLYGFDPAAAPPNFEQWLGLVEPEDRAAICNAEQALQVPGAGSLRLEFRIRRRSDGARRWLVTLGRLVRDEAGRPSRIIGVNFDITDGRQAEDDLRHATALLRAIGTCSPDPIYAKDTEGRLLFVNPAALAVIGRTAEEVIGRTEAEWHPDPARFASVQANERHVIETGRAEVVEETFDPTGSGGRVFRSAKAPLRLEDGTVLGVVAVSSDITQTKATETALRESEERFRAIFEQAAVGMALDRLDGTWIRVNDHLCTMLGYRRDELLALNFRDVTHPDDLAGNLASFQRLVDGKDTIFTIQKRYVRKDGSHLWGNLTVSLVRDPAGTPQYLIAVIEDISQRKLAETALRESETRFRKLFEGAPLPGYLIDPADASIVDCNDAAAAMLGYDRDTLRGMHVQDIDTFASKRGLVSREPALTGRSIQFETRNRTRSGELLDVIIAAVPVDIGERRLSHITVVDITERKRAEARFRATFDQAAVGIAHVALNGRFLRVNGTISAALGYRREELLGLAVQDLVTPEQRAEVLAQLRSIALGEISTYSADRRYIAADGRVLEVAATVSMVDDGAEPPYLLVVAQDIGDRKRAEADLRRLTEDLEARVREEVAARETAQNRAAQAERLQALGQLAGGIAHDFNNVLQAIQGGAGLIMLRATDPAAVRRLAQTALDAADRGASITRRLLVFASRGNLLAESVAAAAILDGIREILASTLGPGIAIRVDAAPDLPPLLADRGQLETALINLATNARDAMPHGGTLTLSAVLETVAPDSRHPANLAAGGYVCIGVADTGTGMDEATLDRAFQPFFSTKLPGHGTGLGLAVVKGFTDQSGGGVVIESTPGQGTTVRLWLPLAPANI